MNNGIIIIPRSEKIFLVSVRSNLQVNLCFYFEKNMKKESQLKKSELRQNNEKLKIKDVRFIDPLLHSDLLL